MKIGILGGTFNPIHIGHLILAEEAREKLGLDRIFFVPAYQPPHKDNSQIAPADKRLEMVRLAIKGNKNFSVSDTEIKRDGKSYTIDTIREFKKTYQHDELFFIIGSDLLNYLDEWKDLGDIIKLVKFSVVTRPGFALDKIPNYISTFAINAVDISGFQIRRRVKENKSLRYLVPDDVREFIIKNKLYK